MRFEPVDNDREDGAGGGFPMKRTPLLPAVALTFALVGLSACNGTEDGQQTAPGGQPSAAVSSPPSSPATPSPAPTPTPTKTPSVDPRTAAVTKAVNRYYKVTDELYRKPNRAPWRKLQTVTRGEAFLMWQNEILDMFAAKQHVTGTIKHELIKVDKGHKKSGHLQTVATACWDVSATDVVNKSGKSVIDKKKRPNHGSKYLTLRLDDTTWYVVKERNGHAKC